MTIGSVAETLKPLLPAADKVKRSPAGFPALPKLTEAGPLGSRYASSRQLVSVPLLGLGQGGIGFRPDRRTSPPAVPERPERRSRRPCPPEVYSRCRAQGCSTVWVL